MAFYEKERRIPQNSPIGFKMFYSSVDKIWKWIFSDPPPPSKMVKKSNSSWPGYHVAARVGKLHVRNGGDDFREKRPKTTTNIIMQATIKGAM